MTKIIYTRKKEEILVDDEDYEFLNRFTWGIGSKKSNSDYVNNNKRIVVDGKVGYISTKMHRLLMGNPENMVVDHINGNKLDNRKANLRVCTPLQNIKNRKLNANSTTGYKGVTFHYNKWRARISINGKRIALGEYECPKSAAKAYNEASLKYHGEYGRLNVIQP